LVGDVGKDTAAEEMAFMSFEAYKFEFFIISQFITLTVYGITNSKRNIFQKNSFLS